MQTETVSYADRLVRCRFSEKDFERANKEWGCNCGPGALAFVLGIDLDQVRPLIEGFDEKRYTSPTMMEQAIKRAWRGVQKCSVRSGLPPDRSSMHTDGAALVRVQWTGPWTDPGANPRWAYGHTHWIATFGGDMVFDINGGQRTLESWEELIVPALVAVEKRRSGGWYPTHVWKPV